MYFRTLIRFETNTCGRCGGSGNYSYNQMHGSTCYGCGGSGLKLTKRSAKVSNERLALRKQLRESVAQDLQLGEKCARLVYRPQKLQWRTLVSKVDTGEPCAWSGSGDQRKVSSTYHVLTFDDGTEERVSGCLLYRKWMGQDQLQQLVDLCKGRPGVLEA